MNENNIIIIIIIIIMHTIEYKNIYKIVTVQQY